MLPHGTDSWHVSIQTRLVFFQPLGWPIQLSKRVHYESIRPTTIPVTTNERTCSILLPLVLTAFPFSKHPMPAQFHPAAKAPRQQYSDTVSIRSNHNNLSNDPITLLAFLAKATMSSTTLAAIDNVALDRDPMMPIFCIY